MNSITARALKGDEIRNSRYLDALYAFRTHSGLRMDGGEGGSGGDGGGAGDGGQGGSGQGDSGGDSAMAVDANGRSLGYPKDTPVAQMTAEQSSAYWQHQSQKHEGRFKNLVGDRSFDDTKKALEEYARIQREQQTPAEQALADAREEGKKAGLTAANQTSAKTIFEGALLNNGVTEADATELVKSLNVDAYIGENGVDVKGLTAFAQRFKPGTGDNNGGSSRDFGAGNRPPSGSGARGAAGKAEAEKRFGKKSA